MGGDSASGPWANAECTAIHFPMAGRYREARPACRREMLPYLASARYVFVRDRRRTHTTEDPSRCAMQHGRRWRQTPSKLVAHLDPWRVQISPVNLRLSSQSLKRPPGVFAAQHVKGLHLRGLSGRGPTRAWSNSDCDPRAEFHPTQGDLGTLPEALP